MSIYDHYKFFEAARCRFCWKKGTSFQKRKVYKFYVFFQRLRLQFQIVL